MRTLAELESSIAEIYRPETLSAWQRRVTLKLRAWLNRPDLAMNWSECAESSAVFLASVSLPERTRAPRFIGFLAPLSEAERALIGALALHVANVVEQMEQQSGAEHAPNTWRDALSTRRLEFALAAAQGLNNAEIAHRLSVAPRTVASQLQAVYDRLGKRRVDLRREWRCAARREAAS